MGLYDILGISRDASPDAVKSAYRKMVVVHHPDKGGNEEKFKEIQKAYEILSDDKRRQMYDMTGNESEEQAQGGNPFGGMGVPFDLGSMFGGMFGGGMHFGNSGGPQRRRRGEKAPPKTHEIPLSLDDFYNGRMIHMEFDKQVFCEQCKGHGSESTQTCGECRGQGQVTKILQMGPGMMMQTNGPCDSCRGQGEKVGPACKKCNGNKMKSVKKTLEVKIEAGSVPGQRLVFEGECSDTHEYDKAGDVHIILQEAENKDKWERKGNDLYNDVTVRLGESLTGCKRVLPGHPAYPNGLELQIPAGVQHGSTVRYANEGMLKRGSVIIRISVIVQKAELDVLAVNKQAFVGMFGVSVEDGGISGVI